MSETMRFESANRFQSFRYAPPCIAVWTLYLLAFWPGLMSPDSIAQWDQVVKTSFSNNYPAFHTLSNWVITRLWLSPAAIAVAQIIALAGVFSLTIAELERWGVSARVRAWVTAAFCLSPVNGMMVITLWKDIPYSCAMLGLLAVVLRTVRSDGLWLRSAQGMAALWSTVVALSLYRHNGLPVVLLLLAHMMIVWRHVCLRQLVRVSVNWLLFFLIVTGPVYRLIGVFPMAKFFALQNMLHQIAAMMSQGEIRSSADLGLLASIQPVDSWLHHYDCYSLNVLVYNGNVRHLAVESIGGPLVDLWWRSLIQNPGIVLAHQKCVTSALWRISEPPGQYGRLYTTEWNIVQNELGLRSQTLWPWLHDVIYRAVVWSYNPQVIWFIWRPAIYLYALMLCVAIAAIRTRNFKLLVVGSPAVLNSLVWFPLITTQDFRFQYPVYVMALVVLSLLSVGRPEKQIKPTT